MTSALAEGCDELLRTAPEHLTNALIALLPPSARPSGHVASALQVIQGDLRDSERENCCLTRVEKYADAKVCFRGASLGVTLSRLMTQNRKRKRTTGPRATGPRATKTSAIFWLKNEATPEDMDWIDSQIASDSKSNTKYDFRVRCEYLAGSA